MRLPKPLLRHDPHVHKNDFGHVLVMAGSAPMLGAAALVSLAAMHSGAGLVTCAVPRSLNLTLQKKIAPVIMTLPLPEIKESMWTPASYAFLQKRLEKFTVIALGPGLGQSTATCRFVLKVVADAPLPMVIDADALNALAHDPKILLQTKSIKILTPHPGEMGRLTGFSAEEIEKNRKKAALNFARKYQCVLILKGHETVVASPEGKLYINNTGNAGMAKAGSGDVLTGMVAALLAQNISPWEAAKTAVYLHGKAGDAAARAKSKLAMTATDIIDHIKVPA